MPNLQLCTGYAMPWSEGFDMCSRASGNIYTAASLAAVILCLDVIVIGEVLLGSPEERSDHTAVL